MSLNYTKKEVNEWCKRYLPNTVVYINNNLTIDVKGDLNIFANGETILELPYAFSKVEGTCYLSSLGLTTLKNAPISIEGAFDCSDNKLTTLEHGPQKVGGYYDCSDNLLTDLNLSADIGSALYAYDNKIRHISYLSNDSFDGIDLSGNLIDNFSSLKKLKKISWLSLQDINFTQEHMMQLTELDNIDAIYCYDSHYKKESIELTSQVDIQAYFFNLKAYLEAQQLEQQISEQKKGNKIKL